MTDFTNNPDTADKLSRHGTCHANADFAVWRERSNARLG